MREDEINIWCVSLDKPPSTFHLLGDTLDADDRARAGLIVNQTERMRFVASRGILRSIIGGYVRLDPGELSFRYGLQGKPALVQDSDGFGLRFNLSHSDGLGIMAFSLDHEIGVDLERMTRRVGTELFATRFLSKKEKGDLRELPAGERHKAFYRIWTRKEALLKASGEGLTRLLGRSNIYSARSDETVVIADELRSQAPHRWSIKQLMPALDFMGAVAVEGSLKHLQCWQWDGHLTGD